MADFNTGVNSGSPGPMAVPTAGHNPAMSNTFGLVAGAVTGLGSTITTAIQNDAAQKAKDIKNNALAGYQQEVLKIADAQDQGIISQDQARSRARLLQSQAIANNPSLREDINKLFSETMNSTGLASSILSGTQQEQDDHALKVKLATDAQTAGMLMPWMSPDEQELAMINYQKLTQAKERMAAAKAAIEFKTSQFNMQNAELGITKSHLQIQGERLSNAGKVVSNASARIELANKQHEQEVIAGSQKMFEVGSDQSEMEYKHVADQVASGQITREEGVLAIQELNRRQHLVIDPTVASGGAAARVAETFGTLLDKRAQTWISHVSGKMTEDQLKTDINRQDLVEQQIALQSSPTLKRNLALQHLVGYAIDGISEPLLKDAIEAVRANSKTDSNGNTKTSPTSDPANLTGSGGTNPVAARQYLDMTKFALGKINSGNATQVDQDEVETHVRNIIGGLGVFGSTVNNPTKLDTLMTFMASPEFGAYAVKHPDIYTSREAEAARDSVGRYYTSKIIPLIQNEFIKNNVTVGYKPASSPFDAGKGTVEPDVRKTTGTISVVYDRNQVRFVPNDTFKDNKAVIRKAAVLTNEVGPVLNKLIKIDAHMDGATNYADHFATIMGRIESNQDRVADVDDVAFPQ